MRGRLIRYLLLPRPGDLFVKGLFLVLPMLLAVDVTSRARPTLGQATACVVILEVLIYQGRYAVNDLIGRREDAHHPHASRRRRLPSGSRKTISAVWVTVALRVGLAAGLAAALPDPLRRGIVVAVAAVVVLAVVYETLRHRIRSSPRPDPYALRPAVLGLWACVGLGYSVRGVLGYWVGAKGLLPVGTLAVVLVSFGLLGTMHVTMAWVLEGVAVLAEDPGAAAPGGVLAIKSHLAPLVRWAGYGVVAHSRRALAPPTPARAPWNVCFVAAAPCAAVQGAQAARALHAAVPVGVLLAAAITGAVSAALARRLPLPGAVVALVGAGLCVVWAALGGAATPVAAGVPLLGVLVVYLVLRGLSYAALLR